MNQRLVGLVLALAVGTSGCANGGQHRRSVAIPLLMLGAIVVGGVLVASTYHEEKCQDPVCGGMQPPR